MIVDDLAVGAHGEVRGDEASRAGEPSLATGHRPDDGPVLAARDGARTHAPLAHRDERQRARRTVADRAVLDEGSVVQSLDVRLEHRMLPGHRLDPALDAAGAEHGPERLA